MSQLKLFRIVLQYNIHEYTIKMIDATSEELCKVYRNASLGTLYIYVRAAEVQDAFNLAVHAFQVGG